jgi:hypothetical protein
MKYEERLERELKEKIPIFMGHMQNCLLSNEKGGYVRNIFYKYYNFKHKAGKRLSRAHLNRDGSTRKES